MCGIAGIWSHKEIRENAPYAKHVLKRLQHRGPDHQDQLTIGHAQLFHTRLSIIDITAAGNQPMSDPTGRWHLVFNGEIFNFRALRKSLEQKGVKFRSQTDSEVLLHLFAAEGPACLKKLNGFFAFAIYDLQNNKLFLARDRMGQKPLLYSIVDGTLYFASELSALLAFPVPRKIDGSSLQLFLQLNYIPAPYTILQNVYKLLPGNWLEISTSGSKTHTWYEIPAENRINSGPEIINPEKALYEALDRAVETRLESDVPLGSFLSGGLDSSIITYLASRKVKGLKTFSIGYRDAQFFDETSYAKQVAESLQTEHHAFHLTAADLLENVHDILLATDEPFADSSAIPFYLLSKLTKEHVTVALSGDGADELFSGYNKHRALFRAQQVSASNRLLKFASPFLQKQHGSRHSGIGQVMRKLRKYSNGLSLERSERYWLWATFMENHQSKALLIDHGQEEMLSRKSDILSTIGEEFFNDFLAVDTRLVLPNDMLKKVDMMSMASALEVRSPFLDPEVVQLAFDLPHQHKVSTREGKLILRQAFKHYLPQEVLQRPKKGFEVPLRQWLRGALYDELSHVLDPEFLEDQNLFNPHEIQKVEAQLHSSKPGDSPYHLWAILVFQSWYQRFMV